MSEIRPETTTQAIRAISEKSGIDIEIVRRIVDSFVNTIKETLRAEIPFSITNLGKLYFVYRKPGGSVIPESMYKMTLKKVIKKLTFSIAMSTKQDLEGYVDDLEIKTNDTNELLKIKIKPEELEKIRSKALLRDQTALGFRPELLFDEVPLQDRDIDAKYGKAPTAEEIRNMILASLNL